MPAVASSTIRFGENIRGEKCYFIDLAELVRVFPHIKGSKNLRFYVIELRDENDKLIKRFKPFKELELKIDKCWVSSRSAPFIAEITCLVIPEDIAHQLNVGDNYRITIIITACGGKPFLPLEVKLMDRESERAFEHFSRIEAGLLLLSLEEPLLNEAVSYLWDAYARLEENDVEGARTSIRNSLRDMIRDKFVPKIEVVGEAEEFPRKLKGLVGSLIELVQYLAKMLEDRVISLKKEE